MAKEPKRISRCSLFAKSKKIGTAEGGSLTLNDNGEPHVTDEGWTQSDGTTTCEVKLNTIISVEGSTKFMIAPGTYEILFKISRIEVERMVQNWVHYHPGVTATIVRTYVE